MLQAVAGHLYLHPGDANRRKLFQPGQIGVGVEVVVAGRTATALLK